MAIFPSQLRICSTISKSLQEVEPLFVIEALQQFRYLSVYDLQEKGAEVERAEDVGNVEQLAAPVYQMNLTTTTATAVFVWLNMRLVSTVKTVRVGAVEAYHVAFLPSRLHQSRLTLDIATEHHELVHAACMQKLKCSDIVAPNLIQAVPSECSEVCVIIFCDVDGEREFAMYVDGLESLTVVRNLWCR